MTIARLTYFSSLQLVKNHDISKKNLGTLKSFLNANKVASFFTDLTKILFGPDRLVKKKEKRKTSNNKNPVKMWRPKSQVKTMQAAIGNLSRIVSRSLVSGVVERVDTISTKTQGNLLQGIDNETIRR